LEQQRQAWQHPCGPLTVGAEHDPREKYRCYFPADFEARLILDTTRRAKCRSPIPQFEFGFTNDTFKVRFWPRAVSHRAKGANKGLGENTLSFRIAKSLLNVGEQHCADALSIGFRFGCEFGQGIYVTPLLLSGANGRDWSF
jgi:hypothetical protein